MAALRPHVEELRRIGVDPFVIGSGTPAQARDFQRHLHVEELPILTDEALVSYRAAGLKRSIGATLHPSTWLRGMRAMKKHRQRKTAGDPWQLGGAMLVQPKGGGTVSWHFVSKVSGDHPSEAQLLDEARRAVA